MKKIVLTGGGTAGHIYPALALLPYLKDYEVHYIGSNGMEKEILSKYKNITFHEIPSVKLVRKLTWKNLLIPFKLFRSVKCARKILKDISPNIIFSKGGFVSVPVVFAGKRLKIPIISHESDLSMGLANKLILKKCDVMCTTFLQTAKASPKCIFTGQPIRKDVLENYSFSVRSKFYNNKPCVLVIGGSSGATFLNEIIWANLEELTQSYNIIHLTGKNHQKEQNIEGYSQLEYSNNIGALYNSVDLVISRAGSGVINELLALKKLMLLIPLSKKCSRGDQIENAELFKKLGYADLLFEEDFSQELFLKKISNLLKNKEKHLTQMKKADASNAAEKIYELIQKYEEEE